MDEGDGGAFVEEGEMLMEGGRKWARRGEREKEAQLPKTPCSQFFTLNRALLNMLWTLFLQAVLKNNMTEK